MLVFCTHENFHNSGAHKLPSLKITNISRHYSTDSFLLVSKKLFSSWFFWKALEKRAVIWVKLYHTQANLYPGLKCFCGETCFKYYNIVMYLAIFGLNLTMCFEHNTWAFRVIFSYELLIWASHASFSLPIGSFLRSVIRYNLRTQFSRNHYPG